eukprot:jgi/Tetstr1/426373/TSEL_016685.t1
MNDGRRVYFSTSLHESSRPQFLKAEYVRATIPRSSGTVVGRMGAAAMAGLEAPASRGVQVTGALYSDGALLMSEAQNDRRATKLMGVVRDLTMPVAGPMMGYASQASLREMSQYVDHLSTQHLQAPKRFVLIRSCWRKRSTDKIEQFFKSYGPGESAAMCLMLIIAPVGQVSTQVAQGAQQVFESPHFTVLEPQFKSSGAHEGLCLVLARLVRPMWDKKVLVPVQGGSGFMKCPYSITQLEVRPQGGRPH